MLWRRTRGYLAQWTPTQFSYILILCLLRDLECKWGLWVSVCCLNVLQTIKNRCDNIFSFQKQTTNQNKLQFATAGLGQLVIQIAHCCECECVCVSRLCWLPVRCSVCSWWQKTNTRTNIHLFQTVLLISITDKNSLWRMFQTEVFTSHLSSSVIYTHHKTHTKNGISWKG